MTRQKKTPRQRAEEQLAIAERAVNRLGDQANKLGRELDKVRREHAQAVARRDHLRQHPDLPRQKSTTITPKETHQ